VYVKFLAAVAERILIQNVKSHLAVISYERKKKGAVFTETPCGVSCVTAVCCGKL